MIKQKKQTIKDKLRRSEDKNSALKTRNRDINQVVNYLIDSLVIKVK